MRIICTCQCGQLRCSRKSHASDNPGLLHDFGSKWLRTRILLPWHLGILFLTLLPNFCAGSDVLMPGHSVFSPKSKAELKSAVAACLQLSPHGDCSDGPYGPIGEWDLSSITDMSRMFAGSIDMPSDVAAFNVDLSEWDVSSVTDMNFMFARARSFNGDISKWDVSSVTDMRSMFQSAESFNGDVSNWDVSSVIDMRLMFSNSAAFNVDLSNWDVSSVTGMNYMFAQARSFDRDISKWDVSSVTDMSSMFRGALLFNGDISKWDVSSVADMSGMFSRAIRFIGDISKWDVSSATDMNNMFWNAASFNSDISKWDVSSVIDMSNMFSNAASFKHTLCGAAWVHSKAIKTLMFTGSSGSIPRTVCSALSPQDKTELKSAVAACLELSPQGDCSKGTHGPIGEWDVSRITDMSRMFAGSFKADSSKLQLSKVTDMSNMFLNSAAFNVDLSKWDVSSVTDMKSMFAQARSFDRDISKWDVSSVTDMNLMFWNAESFDADISKWDVSSVTDMGGMFSRAIRFNGDISKWDVSSATDMNNMFWNAASFNADISKWDVSRVADLGGMFSNAASFNHTLCEAAWVYSKAKKPIMFVGSPGSISQTLCTSELTADIVVTSQYVSRRPIPERELIVRTPTTTPVSAPVITIGSMMTCLKCGTFRKSGRVSCCAPGGAWYKSCGGSGNSNTGHTWSDGVKACTPMTKTTSSVCATCVTIRKSGKTSCCGRGGSWFGTCGGAGNAKVEHTWYQGIRACKARRQSKAAMGQQLRAAQQQKRNGSSNDPHITINPRSVAVAATMFASTPANTSTRTPLTKTIIVSANNSVDIATTPTRVTIVTALPITVRDQTPSHASPTRDTVTKTAKSIAAATIHNSANMSTSTPNIPPTDPSIITPAKGTMNAPAGPTIIRPHRESIRDVLADAVATTPSSPASTGTSITGQELKNPLSILVHCISFSLIIVCWY